MFCICFGICVVIDVCVVSCILGLLIVWLVHLCPIPGHFSPALLPVLCHVVSVTSVFNLSHVCLGPA